MLPFHRRLAEIGLTAIAEFGFVLAGGYAISAKGMGDRSSQDIDMFTNRSDRRDTASIADHPYTASEEHYALGYVYESFSEFTPVRGGAGRFRRRVS